MIANRNLCVGCCARAPPTPTTASVAPIMRSRRFISMIAPDRDGAATARLLGGVCSRLWLWGRATSSGSFDHLVGALLQIERHVEAQHFGSFEVDDQFELSGLHDW